MAAAAVDKSADSPLMSCRLFLSSHVDMTWPAIGLHHLWLDLFLLTGHYWPLQQQLQLSTLQHLENMMSSWLEEDMQELKQRPHLLESAVRLSSSLTRLKQLVSTLLCWKEGRKSPNISLWPHVQVKCHVIPPLVGLAKDTCSGRSMHWMVSVPAFVVSIINAFGTSK